MQFLGEEAFRTTEEILILQMVTARKWISEEIIEEVRRLKIWFLYYRSQYYVTGADINDEKGEPQDKKGEVMIGILSSMNETLKGVKGDTSRMLEKQDMMLEKQDETIDAIDQSKEEIVTEISSLRGDLRSYMEEKFAKIKYELEAIKAKIGMV
jgi:hypothetical protein